MTTIVIDRAEAEKLLDQEAMKALSDAQKSLNELNAHLAHVWILTRQPKKLEWTPLEAWRQGRIDALQDELAGVAKQIRMLRNQIKQTGLRGHHG